MSDYEKTIREIENYMAENPREALSVFKNVISALRRNDLEWAQKVIEIDTDKFSDRRKVLSFCDSVGLISPEYRARLVRWDISAKRREK